jgi:DeoR family fructose operon transcriptional repressor
MSEVNKILFEEERKTRIVEYVNLKSRASVKELCNEFNVSASTVRRDLKELEDAERIKRTHGGAIPIEHKMNMNSLFGEKQSSYQNEKMGIARKAVELIEDGDKIILDSGTTTYELAKLIIGKRLTVVTNSIVIAQILQEGEGIVVVLTGGRLRKNQISLVGPIAEEAFDRIKADKVFISTNGVDINKGLTTPNLTEASMKRRMIGAGKYKILLADHTKTNLINFAKFADITDLDYIITDTNTSDDFVSKAEEKGVEVVIG